MVNENLNINNLHDEDEAGFDFKTILMKLFIYWKWIVVSVIACLCCAVVYLRMRTERFIPKSDDDTAARFWNNEYYWWY